MSLPSLSSEAMVWKHALQIESIDLSGFSLCAKEVREVISNAPCKPPLTGQRKSCIFRRLGDEQTNLKVARHLCRIAHFGQKYVGGGGASARPRLRLRRPPLPLVSANALRPAPSRRGDAPSDAAPKPHGGEAERPSAPVPRRSVHRPSGDSPQPIHIHAPAPDRNVLQSAPAARHEHRLAHTRQQESASRPVTRYVQCSSSCFSSPQFKSYIRNLEKIPAPVRLERGA
jgi:hypothetical protein